MSTAVKNQLKVCALSIKYNIMREMINKVTFLTNICFMMINNATFIIQWGILFRIKEDIGGYTLNDVMLLWGLASSSYGLARVLFARAFALPSLIINGKLDTYLVQPKNVLLSVITSSTNTSAIGDLLYGIVVVCIFSFSPIKFVLFCVFTITGAVIVTAFALLMGSLSFWFIRAEIFGHNMVSILISFSTYPDGIFKGAVRFMMYLLIPVGMSIYLPVHTMLDFNIKSLLIVFGYAVLLSTAAAFVFYRGLRRYSSSNLMEARM